jgi:L-lactate dehydrogenase complex protein LldE
VKVLERLGCTVDFPAAQTCCGQPMHNNGFAPEAKALAARMIRVFADSEFVVTPSGSCAAMIRDYYPELFRDDPAMRRAAEAFAGRVHEFAEFLVKVVKADLRTPARAGRARQPITTRAISGASGSPTRPFSCCGKSRASTFVR